MHKKKEIIIIIFVLLVTIILVLLPIFLDKKESEVKEKDNNNFITITITGEINYIKSEFDEVTNTIKLVVLSGITFGEISKSIDIYYTKYSIKPTNYKTRYFTDTTITILSSYNENKTDVINKNDERLININTASKIELKTLYGIGDARAESIITYREKKLIESYQELKEIIGVSDEIIEIIKNSSIL